MGKYSIREPVLLGKQKSQGRTKHHAGKVESDLKLKSGYCILDSAGKRKN